MQTVLAEVTRGGAVESWHYGSVAVVNSAGKVLAHAGDPETVTFMRSASKPLLALNVFRAGAMEKFNFTQQELSIFCASHYGEDFHRTVIHGLLDKMGYSLADLLCGAPYSYSATYRSKQRAEHHVMTTANSGCSGKHCGFLSVCNVKGYRIRDYDQLEHPMQQEILHILADYCDMQPHAFAIGLDGCGVPVHTMPLRNMAMSYARFANPVHAPAEDRAGCRALYDAMNAAPEMLAGTGGFCTAFLRHTNGKFCGKLGSESVYCIGVQGQDMGIAIKIADGSYRALYITVMHTLDQLGLLTAQEKAALAHFAHTTVRNTHGAAVGEIRPAFTLTMATS